MTSATAAGPYGPITKSIDIDEALMLIGLTREYPDVQSWREEAMARLPQASHKRRQEIVHDVQKKFLAVEGNRFAESQSARLLATERLSAKLRRDLLLAQYLRATPLVWEAVRDVVLPRSEAGARQLAGANTGEITLEDWTAFLTGRLSSSTPSTVEKTRNHITAHLTKFGLLEARAVPGDRIAKRFYAHFYEPDVRAFWFSLAMEFDGRGWTSRSLDFVSSASWTRIAYCATPAFVRYAVEEAERAGLVATDFFGSEKQVTLRGPEPVARIVEMILH
jgi:hypothetical protein